MTPNHASRSAAGLDALALRSVEVLKAGQADTGAFVASPAFATYGYAWLRDGAFCAYALDLVAETEAAADFHRWVVESVEAHRRMIESAIERVDNGEAPRPEEMPPARYTLDGGLERAEDDPWPNFQVDGYGMWLWALERHLDGRRPDAGTAAVIRLVARYLAATWQLKCFSCWEEFDDGEHASTLGAVIAGIESAARMLGDAAIASGAEPVRARLLDAFVVDGRFRRGPTDDRVDGSLLWLSVAFAILPLDDRRVVATVEAIRRELSGPGGGIYRYRGDTYYGGGQWLLLTSSLVWHDIASGTTDGVGAREAWVRDQALPNGDLPEQVTGHAQDVSMIEPWVRRWGPVATPLLWSHAMYVIAKVASL
jgi:GH15 family glucan-1,4-alpha-glucosidase